jgi:hypothetical protein
MVWLMSTTSPTTVRAGLSAVWSETRWSPTLMRFAAAKARVTTISPGAWTQRPEVMRSHSAGPWGLSLPTRSSGCRDCPWDDSRWSRVTYTLGHGPANELAPVVAGVDASWPGVTRWAS